MCNRYVLDTQEPVDQDWLRVPGRLQVSNFNVSPTQAVSVVRANQGTRELAMVRWGLVPFWAKGIPGKYPTMNARIETMATLNSYRGPWKHGQRCLQLATGFYEWHEEGARKAPWCIRVSDQPLFAFASLWERSAPADGDPVESCTIITMPANTLMAHIHNSGNNPHRMPAILDRKDVETWLTGTPAEAMAVLKPYPADLMDAYEVSTRVNSPRNNDPDLIKPV